MYSPLTNRSVEDSRSEAESHEQLLEKESLYPDTLHTQRIYINYGQTLAIALAILFITLSSFILGTWYGSWRFVPTGKEYLQHVQHYSPILSEVDTSLHTVRFNGSFMKENDFRKGAGPEVDAAWASLGVDYRSVAIPASEGPTSGLTKSHVQISPKYGGGFPTNVEGLHHLHCLNLVRQSLYFNYDYYHSKGEGAFVNEDNIVRYHVTHCLDIVRQQLMCMPDTGVLGQVWWDKAAPKAFVDFNTEHKCKNYDAIREWAKERQIPESVPEDFLEPPGEVGDIMDEIP